MVIASVLDVPCSASGNPGNTWEPAKSFFLDPGVGGGGVGAAKGAVCF